MEFYRFLISVTRPGSILIAILMYFLGVGISDYLGNTIDWVAYWIGLSNSILLLISSQLLDVFFRSIDANPTSKKRGNYFPADAKIPVASYRRLTLQIAITTLTIVAVLTVLLIAQGKMGFTSLLFLGICFLLGYFYAVPPLSFSQRGLGEVIEAILIVNLISAYGFLLQSGEIHRLLIMLTIPFTFLMIAMRLALSLPKYGEDIQAMRINMMTGLGWERGMVFHNYLVVFAYVFIALAFIFGLPWRLVWPALLTLPIGFYQILQMRQIASGVKPNWKVLTLTSITLFGLTAYLITISLWIG